MSTLIALEPTNQVFEAVLTSAPSIQPSYQVVWAIVDESATPPFKEQVKTGYLSSTTPVVLVPVLTTGQRCLIKAFNIYNRDASDITAIVRISVAGQTPTLYPLRQAVIAQGESFTQDGIFSATGVLKTGIKGDKGDIGLSPLTTTTASFNQPAVGSSVVITVGSSIAFGDGQLVQIQDGGTYRVLSKPSATQLQLENLYDTNAPATSAIASGKVVSVGGSRGGKGDKGDLGAASFTSTTANYTQPAVLSDVAVQVAASAGFAIGQIVFVQTGGYYSVQDKPSATQLLLRNLFATNAAANTTISTGQLVTTAGQQGPQGPSGGSTVNVADEGGTATAVTGLNFTGAGIEATVAGGIATVNVPGSAKLDVAQTFTKAQRIQPVALTSAATIAIDASASNRFTLTLGTNATLSNPTNVVAGTAFELEIKQDATGSRTLAYGSNYKFQGAAPALSTAANTVDLLACVSFDGTNLRCTLNKGW